MLGRVYRGAALAGLIVGSLAVGSTATQAAGESIVLAPHRAVYDMTLGNTRPGSSVTAVKGRLVYELTGTACEGFTQNMRFVTEMATQDSQPVLTDLRSTTWEDGNASLFRFNTTQLRDQKPADSTVGDAKRAGPTGPIAVELTKPAKRELTLKPGTYYPVQHSIALLIAARAGKSTLRADLFDGSEKGDKAYDTLARIGAQSATDANKKLPVLKDAAILDGLPSWPVNISYYEPGKDKSDATPAYELSFLFFDNGVSRKLVIDYGDFAIKGELSSITFLETSKCDPKP